MSRLFGLERWRMIEASGCRGLIKGNCEQYLVRIDLRSWYDGTDVVARSADDSELSASVDDEDCCC